MNKVKIRIAIADDHQIVIDGIKSLLQGHADFEIVIETTDPLKMTGLLENQQADILLTDVMMPGMNGAELAKTVRHKFPHIKILALSMSGQGDLVNQMIKDSDISGYVLKNIGKQELISALGKIASGGIYFSDEAHLTMREIEIIKLIEKEFSNKMIAETLFLSERTVETHRKNIFRKTKTSSLIGLIKYAYEHRLI
jgi:two-component system nitrate/nitrite response regulator NarL